MRDLVLWDGRVNLWSVKGMHVGLYRCGPIKQLAGLALGRIYFAGRAGPACLASGPSTTLSIKLG
jgi:hypothetical protein